MPAKEMNAVFIVDAKKLEVRKAPILPVGHEHVRVKVHYTGICGSNLHVFQSGVSKGYRVADRPYITRHESAGEVVEVGEGVTSLKIGDRVTIEPQIACGKCELCREGKYNLCKNLSFLCVPPLWLPGTLADYVNMPADMCYKLSESVSTLEGALVEPLAVGLQAVSLANATLGMNALVFGSGCIGIMTLVSLLARGVSRVAMVDLVDLRLKKALELGATLAINSKTQNVIEIIDEWTDSRGVDVVFDASGSYQAIEQMVDVTRPGGTMVQVGNVANAPHMFNIQKMMDKELLYTGVHRYRNLFPTAINAIASGKTPVDKMVDKIYPFEQSQEAFLYKSEKRRVGTDVSKRAHLNRLTRSRESGVLIRKDLCGL